jgi:peptidyl-tRNA hydrolase
MIGHLYRYPHPTEEGKFLYVGQGAKRDSEHRRGKSSFGRRFKRDFPNVKLPQPIREGIEIKDYLELNELETIWMFQYHTWRGYEGGMNLTILGSADYTNLGILARDSGQLASLLELPQTKAARIITGRKNGLRNVESGLLARLRTPQHQRMAGRISGRIQGPKNVESGQMARMKELPQTKAAKIATGRKNVESGQIACMLELPQTKAARRVTGQKLGRAAVESGRLNRVRELPQTKAAQRDVGRRNVESGQLASILGMGQHARWHVARCLVKSDCLFCIKDARSKAERHI